MKNVRFNIDSDDLRALKISRGIDANNCNWDLESALVGEMLAWNVSITKKEAK